MCAAALGILEVTRKTLGGWVPEGGWELFKTQLERGQRKLDLTAVDIREISHMGRRHGGDAGFC